MRRLITLFLFFSMLSCSTYTDFYPVVETKHGLEKRPELMTDEFRKNIVQVFDFYEVEYEIVGDRILVKESDEELLWNYTTKARDSEWMSDHILRKN